jgi:hypothetical protein
MEPEIFGEPVQEEAVKAKNFFARLGGVFFSPREAFTEIGSAPRLVIPIIALLLISAFGSWYLSQKIDTRAAVRAQLEQAVKQGRINEEQMNQQLAISAAAAGPVLAIAGGGGALIMCLVIAGYGKLFSMMTGSKNNYKSLLAVSVYAMFAVSVVSTVLIIIIMQIKGPGRIEAAAANSIVASNLGAWIESAAGADVLPKFIMSLARIVDIFNIWIIALLSIGFSAVSKKLKTAAATFWLGGAYVIFSVINVAIRSAFGS